MTDETAKRKHKRWRWGIAGVLLFVVAVAGWWEWPRGDARFVGKWKVTELRNGQTTDAGWLDLRRNGSVRWSLYQPSDFRPVNWRVVDQRIVIEDAFANFPRPVLGFFGWFRSTFLGNSNGVGGVAKFKVMAYGHDTVVLEYDAHPISLSLTRVPQ